MSDNSGGGIGFLGALFLLFLGLKLGNVIDWDWIWVFAPLWIPAIIVLAILLVMLIFVWLASEYKRSLRSEFAFPVFEKKKKRWWNFWK